MKNIIETYLEEKAKKMWDESWESSKERNARCCDVCKGTEWVSLYRKTKGELSGSSSFGLFGGSASFRGDIDTDKVLSCRSCHNEKLISSPTYQSAKELFWQEIQSFYFNVDAKREYEILAIYLQHPVETRKYAIDNKNYTSEWRNEIIDWEPSVWAEQGFAISKIKKKFLFWQWESYPTWKELSKQLLL